MMTKEVIISPVRLNDLNGRKEVESSLSQLFKTSKVLQYSLKPDELDVYEDVVYERGIYVWISVADEDTSRRFKGKSFNISNLSQWSRLLLFPSRIPPPVALPLL